MPSVILVASGEILNIPKKGREFFALVFSVRPSQIRDIAPSYYERLKDRDLIKIAVAHADAAGNISMSAMDLIDIANPDAIFCCYPTYARRLYPHLPIVGHSGKTVMIRYDEEFASGVVSIEISEE